MEASRVPACVWASGKASTDSIATVHDLVERVFPVVPVYGDCGAGYFFAKGGSAVAANDERKGMASAYQAAGQWQWTDDSIKLITNTRHGRNKGGLFIEGIF